MNRVSKFGCGMVLVAFISLGIAPGAANAGQRGTCTETAQDVEFDGTTYDSLMWCVPGDPNFDSNRIDILVGKPDQFFKLAGAVGVCKAGGPVFPLVFKDHFKSTFCAGDGSSCNPMDGLCADGSECNDEWNREMWGGDMPENCVGSVDLYIQVVAPGWNPVIEMVLFNHVGPPKNIPTLPEWGLIGLTLLVLTAATVVFGRRRRAAA